MKEWEVQKKLYEQLTNNGYPCYSDKQRPNGGWHPKTFKGDKNRPDLIFFIPQKLQFCNTSKKCERTTLPTPIGVELKIAASFNEITKGIINQIDRRYVKNEYEIQEQNWKGTLPIILFATDNGLETGYVDRYSGNRKNRNPKTINFVIDRLMWRINQGVLKKTPIITRKDLEDGGDYKHLKLIGDFSKENISISYDNNFIALYRC